MSSAAVEGAADAVAEAGGKTVAFVLVLVGAAAATAYAIRAVGRRLQGAAFIDIDDPDPYEDAPDFVDADEDEDDENEAPQYV